MRPLDHEVAAYRITEKPPPKTNFVYLPSYGSAARADGREYSVFGRYVIERGQLGTPAIDWSGWQSMPTGQVELFCYDVSLAVRLVQRLLDRFAYGAPRISFTVPSRHMDLEVCDAIAESDDLFSSAVVRSPLFRAWGTKTYSFEELVALKQQDRFRALAYRPAWRDKEDRPIMRADDSIERDIFRRLSGMRDMPAAARAQDIARPSLFSRLRDRLLSGPRGVFAVPAAGRRAIGAPRNAFGPYARAGLQES